MTPPKTKLLVADDHRLFMEGLRFILKEDLQIDGVEVALNGRQAIDKCNEEAYDVVIMDVNMPVIDGITATKEIKKLHPHIKIMMLSMLSDLPTITRALQAGADAFVLKDAGSEDLLLALKKMRNDELYLSPSIAHYFTQHPGQGIKTKKQYIQFSENILSARELSVLKLIAEGFTNAQIAETLFISVSTADTHRKNMLAKLQLSNTALLVKFAVENKLV